MIKHTNNTTEEWYSDFIVIKNKQGDIIKFEAPCGAWIFKTVDSVKTYLSFNEIYGDFILIFNDIKLNIGAYCSTKRVVNEYFDLLEKGRIAEGLTVI